MPFYTISLVSFLAILILSIIKEIINRNDEKKSDKDGKNNLAFNLSIAVFIITFVVSFVTMNIPKPEIYTTNGYASFDNEIYFVSEWPLEVKYSLTPYDDPQKSGTTFSDNIPITHSTTVSAKATFLGLKWSELVSRDIVIGDDGSLEIIKTDAPGTSIKEIKSIVTKSRLFPNEEITKADLRVEGITISGESVILENYDFEPKTIIEGENEIIVKYANLSCKVIIYAESAALMDLDVEYIGDELHAGDTLTPQMFDVIGLYEDGRKVKEVEFIIDPPSLNESGDIIVTINIGEIYKSVNVNVKPKEYMFTLINELHTPNGSFDPNVYVSAWNENEDYSIDGKTYSNGIKIKFDNWMSVFMGNGHDFAENIESNLYISVNKNVVLKHNPDERYLDGRLVVERNTNGSITTLSVVILADGVEVYNSGEITAVTTNAPAFHINVDNIEQIVFRSDVYSCGYPFILGIIFE